MSVPTAGQGRFSPDDEACVEYETLCNYALGTARDAAIPQDSALVIQRGLLYWHDAWLESKKAVNLMHEFRSGSPSQSSANGSFWLTVGLHDTAQTGMWRKARGGWRGRHFRKRVAARRPASHAGSVAEWHPFPYWVLAAATFSPSLELGDLRSHHSVADVPCCQLVSLG